LSILSSEPALRAQVTAAVRVQGRRWNVRLDNGIDVQLPETDTAAAWAELARLQRSYEVLQRDVVAIDLRLPDRLVVRTAPGAVLAGQGPAGEDT
jgi:cell division protein FtsQ